MRQALIKLLLLSSFLVAGISYAEVFDKLNYSGRIVNSDGSPKTGPIELEVNFYNALTSDTSVSSIDYSSVELTNGTFSLAIDVSSDREIIFNPSNETWIEITDKTNNQTYPRQKLEAVPYAHEAGGIAGHPIPEAQPTNGQVMKWDSSSSSWVWGSTGGAVDPSNISAGAITESKISTGAVTRSKIGNSAVGSNEIDTAAVGSDEIAAEAVDTSELATGSVTNDKLAGSIADTKLLTITAANKVANSATTATATSSTGTIVARDGSGDFSANEITATTFVGSLTGNAATATTAVNVSATVAVANGGTGAGDAAAARTNLGLGALATKDSISAADLPNDSVSLSKLDSTACADDQVIKKTDGVWTCTSISLLVSAPIPGYLKLVEANAGNAGTFNPGSWLTRNINREDIDTANVASLDVDENEITLQAGTYDCEVAAVGKAVKAHQIRLVNKTDSDTVMAYGLTVFTSTNGIGHSTSTLRHRFVFNSPKTILIQHMAESKRNNDGLGADSGFANVDNIHASIACNYYPPQ